MNPPRILFTALRGIPLVRPGDDLARLVRDGLAATGLTLQAGDILVLASKIVSKAQGRVVRLADVEPGARAYELAQVTGKDPRELELILRESQEVVRVRPGLIITRHKLGFVSANAGLDHSNVQEGAGEFVLLLPENPDGVACQLREELSKDSGVNLGVIIADSHGRPHRLGTVGVAIGSSGLPALEDWRGGRDLFNYQLKYTDIGLADMLASAATLLLGQAAEGTPVVHIRGVVHSPGDGTARDLVRPKEMDLFP